MIAVLVGVVLVAVAAIAVARSHNRFVEERTTVRTSWSNIDTELQRRYDLVPNLVDAVRAYAAHERTTFEQVVRARDAAGAGGTETVARNGVERELTRGLRALLAVSEAYPDLRASTHFLDLQQQLVTTENRIQAARRLYNGNVRDFNRRIESFPSNVIARVFRFVRADYFELDPVTSAATAPSVRGIA
jgi:LemA protein